MKDETVWKSIHGYEGIYIVSNSGIIKSLDRLDAKGGKRKGRVIKPSFSKDGYLYVGLCNGKHKTFKVHRIVAREFINNQHNKETVNHIDGDKTNNNVYNLEWSTREEQLVHAYKNNLKKWDKKARDNACNARHNPIKIIDKETGKEYYSVNTSVISKYFKKHRSWARSIIKSGGETSKYLFYIITMNEYENTIKNRTGKTINGVFIKDEDLNK